MTINSASILTAAFLITVPVTLVSCTSGQFGSNYKKISGYKVVNPTPDPNPPVRVAPESAHSSAVRSLQRKGYVPIGMSTIYRRFKVPVQDARELVIFRKGDIGVYSAKYLGIRSERVAVPVSSTVTNAEDDHSSTYSDNEGYRSDYDSADTARKESVHYVYEDHFYKLYRYRATVLAHKKHLAPK